MTNSNVSTKFIERTALISDYLNDVRKDEVLSDAETNKLVKLAKQGNEDAIHKLAAANQRFIFSLAKKRGTSENVMDLVNEGTIGLINAIESFDETKDVKFLSYARFFILREMNYYLTTTDVLIKKSNGTKLATKLAVVRREFLQANGRYPSEQETADILEKKFGLTIQNFSDLYDVTYNYINASIDDEEDGASYEDSPEFNDRTSSINDYENEIEEDGNKAFISSLLSYLNERERTIIEMTYGINYEREYTGEEIADKLNLSKERIRQLTAKALKTLRQATVAANRAN